MRNGRSTAMITVIGLVSVILGAGDAAAQTITGKLAPAAAERYQVIAINRDGKSSVAAAKPSGAFSVKGSDGASIHLLEKGGRYFGPIVLPKGGRAASTLSGKSGTLGTVSVKSAFATARGSRRTAPPYDVGQLIRYSRATGPGGAGRLGLGRLSRSAGTSAQRSGLLGVDSDRDGLPNLIDVDDDGDSILDGADSDLGASLGARPYLFNGLVAELSDSINSNVGQNIDTAAVDSFIRDHLNLVVGFNPGDVATSDVGAANVDCSGLPYCGTDGTAIIVGVGGIPLPSDLPVGSPWRAFDPDSDGFPNLYMYPSSLRREIIIKPLATTQQIGPGDTLLLKIALKGAVQTFPLVLSSVYATIPAALAYSDGTTTGSFSYPISAVSPGTTLNPITLASTNLTLAFWRPQRLTIQGAESGLLVDMGKLKYGVSLSVGSSVVTCTGDDYTNLSPTLTNTGGSEIVLLDSESDAPPNSANFLSFTINLSSCITRAGLSPAGQSILVALVARDREMNNAAQLLHFVLP